MLRQVELQLMQLSVKNFSDTEVRFHVLSLEASTQLYLSNPQKLLPLSIAWTGRQ